MICLFCPSRLRQGVTAGRGCRLSLWKLEYLNHQRNKTQNGFYPTLSHNAAQPTSGECTLSESALKLRNSYAWDEKECTTMKRKMGAALYPSGESPPVTDSEESGNKKVRTDQAAGCDELPNLPTASGTVGKREDCQAKKVVREGEKLIISISQAEQNSDSDRLTKPLTSATKDKVSSSMPKDCLPSRMHQIWKLFPHKNTRPLTKVHNASPQFISSNLTSKNVTLPVSVTACSFTSIAGLGHLSPCLPQNGSQATDYVGILFPGSNTTPVLEANSALVPSDSYHSRYINGTSVSYHSGSSTSTSTPSSLMPSRSYHSTSSLMPSRSYHSTSVSSTTLPLSKHLKQSTNLSSEEKDVENCTENIGKTETQSESSLKEEDRENLEVNIGNSENSTSVSEEKDILDRRVTLTGRSEGRRRTSGRGYKHTGSSAGAEALEEGKASGQCRPGSDASPDAVFEEDCGAHCGHYQHKVRQLPRQWEWTRMGHFHQQHWEKGTQRRGHPVEFSVMTYNILAQNLLEQHGYLYGGCNPYDLEWGPRRELLMGEIAYHSPDILNLQEVDKDNFSGYLKPRLERLGYGSCYQKRTGNKSDGCATLWKKNKFRLLNFTPVTYHRGGLLDRDNIAIIVELQPLRSGRHPSSSGGPDKVVSDKIVVANTHLLFNPRRGDIKLAQLMILLAEIDKHAYLGPPAASKRPVSKPVTPTHGRYCPIILSGDFNLEPQSDLYKFVVGGQMDYEGLLVRTMSGQQEGRQGKNHILERNFFSPMYGVTDSCQYHTAVTARLKASDSRKDLSDSLKPDGDQSGKSLSHGERKSASARHSRPDVGRLWHHLNLVSAYRHRIERLGRAREVTTHHDSGKCSVDYIFYSVDSKDVHYHRNEVRLGSVRDGKLKLLARYGLMSANELNSLGGIPNDLLPSDHLCLITRFLLI